MKALIFNWSEQKRDSGYFDCPWKDLQPDDIVKNVSLDNKLQRLPHQAIFYIENSRPVLFISARTGKESNGISMNSLWYNWP